MPSRSATASQGRLRVLFLCPALHPGGAERTLLIYLRALDRARFEPHLALCRCTGRLLPDVPPDVPLHDLQQLPRFGFTLVVARFWALARRLRPDVVISFLWYADAVQLLARRLSGKRWRAVVTRHIPSSWPGKPSGPGIKRALLRRVYPTADLCLPVSEAVARDFRERLAPGAAVPLVVQHNPHPLAEVRAMAAGGGTSLPWPADAEHRLIAVGRLDPQKGYDVLLRASARLPSDLGWHLAILGMGRERPALEALAAELDVARRVTFAGHVGNPYPAMAAADLLVLSSRSEGLPGVLCEAMALGVAIVATNSGGSAEALAGGAHGLLVPPDEPDALAAAILRLLHDPVELAAWKSRSAAGAERFDLGTLVPRFEALLLRLAGRPS